jgi:hypothetical protein
MTDEQIQGTAEILQAITEENRIRIFWLLFDGTKTLPKSAKLSVSR